MARTLGEALARNLRNLKGVPASDLLEKRYEKFRRMGQVAEE
jgi:acetyl-CoA carboxylase carboxyl transferase subunit alpha